MCGVKQLHPCRSPDHWSMAGGRVSSVQRVIGAGLWGSDRETATNRRVGVPQCHKPRGFVGDGEVNVGRSWRLYKSSGYFVLLPIAISRLFLYQQQQLCSSDSKDYMPTMASRLYTRGSQRAMRALDSHKVE